MTLSEAQQVAAIIAQAHGGCSTCYHDLLDRARELFHEFEWTTTNEAIPTEIDPTTGMYRTVPREDWEAQWAAFDAAWPPGSTDKYGEPCPIRVRLRSTHEHAESQRVN